MTKKTIDWVREDYYDSVEQNTLMLKPELGFASQRAIVDNFESLEDSLTRKSMLGKIKGNKA